MNRIQRKEHILLFLGDIFVLSASLVLTLWLRYGVFPSANVLELHLVPFSILFTAFILVYFISGLYEKHTNIFKDRLPLVLLNVQLVNTIVGISFFYLIPNFSIAPKFVLFLFLVLSLVLMYVWRIIFVRRFSSDKKGHVVQKAILIADSKEAFELEKEVNGNSRYDFDFIKIIKPSAYQGNADSILLEINKITESNEIFMIVLDTNDKSLSGVIPHLYPMAMRGILFFDIEKIYENIFDRIAVSTVGQTWFIEHMSSMAPKLVYDGIKRLTDITVSFLWGIISLPLYPFIMLALKIEDEKNVIFSYQPRIGQYNKVFNIIKFRTMTIANDNGDVGSNKVTKIGAFLRKSRIDELPQLWNVLRGDLSLIGPRPELPDYVIKYSKEIPNYTIRNSVKPGLSGWAQIYHENHSHHGIDVTETANKLSYDLYYIKHRSFLLDLKIALRTLKILATFVGR